jgi:predicted ArsR family transcriptional regulator
VDDAAQMLFARLADRGGAFAEELADELAWTLDAARAVLDELAGRRLVLMDAGHYMPPHAA